MVTILFNLVSSSNLFQNCLKLQYNTNKIETAYESDKDTSSYYTKDEESIRHKSTTNNLIYYSSDDDEEDVIKMNINAQNSNAKMFEKFIYNFGIYYLGIEENVINMESYIISNMEVINSMKYVFETIDYTNNVNARKLDLFLTSNKPLIILDLDETLIHCYQLDNENCKFYTRPYVYELLKYLKKHFYVVLFTAGEKDYVKCVLNELDSNQSYFDFILDRSSCIEFNNIYIKDLRIFNTINKIYIIDNNIYSFSNNLDKGILIQSYFGNEEDTVLKSLMGSLDNLLNGIEDLNLFDNEFKYIKYYQINK